MLAKFVLRRALAAIPVVVGVTVITFVLMHSTAGAYVPGLSLNPNLTAQEVQLLRSQLGLDQPLWIQYLNWTGVAWLMQHVGLGGVLIEVTGRVDGRRLPLRPGAAEQLVDDVAGPAAFARLRGREPWSPGPLVAAIEGVAELWRRHGSWLQSADLNPLLVTADGVCAVDALLVADQQGQG